MVTARDEPLDRELGHPVAVQVAADHHFGPLRLCRAHGRKEAVHRAPGDERPDQRAAFTRVADRERGVGGLQPLDEVVDDVAVLVGGQARPVAAHHDVAGPFRLAVGEVGDQFGQAIGVRGISL